MGRVESRLIAQPLITTAARSSASSRASNASSPSPVLIPAQVAILHVGLGEGFFHHVMELADDTSRESEQGGQGGKWEPHGDQSFQAPHFLTPFSTFSPADLRAQNSQPALKRPKEPVPSDECLAITLSLHPRAGAPARARTGASRCEAVLTSSSWNGQAKLADIGLVTSVDATRSFVGTEGYLPPEGAGTPQADLYSLGKLLYEMSTGCDRKEFPALPSDIAYFGLTATHSPN